MSIPDKIHIDWSAYEPGECFDAIIDDGGQPRPPAVELARTLGELSPRELADRQQARDEGLAVFKRRIREEVHRQSAQAGLGRR